MLRQSLSSCAGRSVFVVSLPEAPGFAVLRLGFPERSGSALVAERGDDALLELVFGLRRQLADDSGGDG